MARTVKRSKAVAGRKEERRKGSKKVVYRSSKDQKRAGLIAAYQVILADAFHSNPGNPCRETDVRDAVAEALKYDSYKRVTLVDRWSQWLRGLPNSAGRIRPEEITAARAWLGPRTELPEYLRARINELVGDATFWALCSTFETTPEILREMRDCFCSDTNDYQIFRYTIGEPNRIAVGKLTIRENPTTGAITTLEEYKVRKRGEHYQGYFLRQKDGAHRIFTTHHGSNEIQVIQFRDVLCYSGRNHPHMKGQAKRMVGTFLDRHEKGFFYTGKTVVQRIDTFNTPLAIRTYSASEINEYDPTIFEDLQLVDEPRLKNLFTFRV